MLAAREGHLDAFNVLLKRGSPIHKSVLHIAAEENHMQVLQVSTLLLARSSSSNSYFIYSERVRWRMKKDLNWSTLLMLTTTHHFIWQLQMEILNPLRFFFNWLVHVSRWKQEMSWTKPLCYLLLLMVIYRKFTQTQLLYTIATIYLQLQCGGGFIAP